MLSSLGAVNMVKMRRRLLPLAAVACASLFSSPASALRHFRVGAGEGHAVECCTNFLPIGKTDHCFRRKGASAGASIQFLWYESNCSDFVGPKVGWSMLVPGEQRASAVNARLYVWCQPDSGTSPLDELRFRTYYADGLPAAAADLYQTCTVSGSYSQTLLLPASGYGDITAWFGMADDHIISSFAYEFLY